MSKSNQPGVLDTFSARPEFPEKQEQVFREVLQILNDCRVPYAVSGAFALQRHTGIWRATKDLDVFLTAASIPPALSCLVAKGFECEVPDPIWLAKAHRDGFYVDLISGMSNAAITVEQTWIDRSQPALISGIETRVLAPEELLASKVFVTRRERFDGADIAHIILGSKGSLEWPRIVELIGEHWELLLWHLVLFAYVYPARTDWIPAQLWRDLLEKFATRVAKPEPNAPFRGSLVDSNMFAIDTKEWGLEDIHNELRERRFPQLPNSLRQCGTVDH